MPVHDVTRHNYENSGHILTLGAHPRPYDPREEKFRLTAAIDVSGVDLSTPHSIVREDASGNVWDPRLLPTWQGQKGACASFTICELAYLLSWQSGAGQPPVLSGSDTYERVRKLENGPNWRADTGSTLAGNCDTAMEGLFNEADAPEGDDLALDYDSRTQGKPMYDFVLGHQPFYPGETSDPDFFVKAIAWAIDQGYGVDLGSAWPDPWFNPDGQGILPPATDAQYKAAGGHSYPAYQVLPILGGVVACGNHWNPPGGRPWNPQVAANGYHLRPGDFLIPFSFFRPGVNPYLEGRVVTAQPVTPAPEPQPAATCRQAALALAQPVVERYAAALSRSPRSVSARHALLGAQAVGDALATMPE